MIVEKTNLKGSFIIQPRVYNDERGYFIESFNQKDFKEYTGLDISFVQDNESKSLYGVLRGLHFQTGQYAQAKLIRAIKGRIMDVIVDIRQDSDTYGQHFSIEISEENKKQLFIPRGFAHGFVVLSEEAIISYKCDNFYNKDSERGIIYNDSSLDIDWKVSRQDLIISNKDLSLPKFKNI